MVHGGYSYYGYKIGILVLDSKIPRIPGDLGNATTYPCPVVYKVVRGATISRTVGDTDAALLEPFIQAARELEAEGCRAITTSCGFLALFQRQLAAAVNIPVFTSSLIQLPFIQSMLAPGRQLHSKRPPADCRRPFAHLEKREIRGWNYRKPLYSFCARASCIYWTRVMISNTGSPTACWIAAE